MTQIVYINVIELKYEKCKLDSNYSWYSKRQRREECNDGGLSIDWTVYLQFTNTNKRDAVLQAPDNRYRRRF